MNRFNSIGLTIVPGRDEPDDIAMLRELYAEYPVAERALEHGEHWSRSDDDLTEFSQRYPLTTFGHEASGEYGEWHTVSYYRNGSSYEADCMVPPFDPQRLKEPAF